MSGLRYQNSTFKKKNCAVFYIPSIIKIMVKKRMRLSFEVYFSSFRLCPPTEKLWIYIYLRWRVFSFPVIRSLESGLSLIYFSHKMHSWSKFADLCLLLSLLSLGGCRRKVGGLFLWSGRFLPRCIDFVVRDSFPSATIFSFRLRALQTHTL